jgi:hypothetical protein
MGHAQRMRILNSLSLESKLALRRTGWRRGTLYTYCPRDELCRRIAAQEGCSATDARDMLLELRHFVIKHPLHL